MNVTEVTASGFENIINNEFGQVSFTWYDYSFFTVMLSASVAIGLYFGCFGSKQETTSEYLLGGKQMKVIPIAISLVASHLSGISLLALPADVYRHGAAYQIVSLSIFIVTLVTVFVYLPVFYKLEITSTYEYLELRFDRRTRQFASFLFGLSQFLYLPIVIYVPALAFEAATGVSVHLIAPVVCGICIFYTTIGGLKAVVWTDTLQFTVTSMALIAISILGTRTAGGFMSVWNKALEGQRLDIFDFDPDPTKRDTFWIIAIGFTVHWIGRTSVNQSCVQKFLAVPNLRKALWSATYYGGGMIIAKTVCVFAGLLMYSRYASCDPLTARAIKRNDQLLPFYVMDVASGIPGLPGLFVAGIFSSALSTLSADLNCLAGTIYEDFVAKFMKEGHSKSSRALKIIVIVTGALSTALVLVFERLGGILQMSISVASIVNGPLLGLFTLGVLVPPANSKGAMLGGTAGMISVGFIYVMSKYYEQEGSRYAPKPLSVTGCPYPFNGTFLENGFVSANNGSLTPPEVPAFFRISYYYYSLIGAVTTVAVGTILSYLLRKKGDDKPVHRDLLSPIIYRLLPAEAEPGKPEYSDINGALHKVALNSEGNNTQAQTSERS